MLGEIDWANLQVASAFVLGAILATVGTLRVMRAVLRIYEAPPLRRRRPKADDEPDES